MTLLWAGAKVRTSGDTWVALASGRLICERGYFDFPLQDQFSFTFEGQVWTNQNWLAQVIYWWVYDHWCPSGLVALKLALVAALGLVTWRSALLLSNDHPLSLLAACAGLLFAAHFFDIRPNLLGLCCLSLLYWTLLMLKHGRGWVLWLIPPLMALWGNAHGSFVFGYAMVVLFLCTEAGQHLVGRQAVLTPWKRLLGLGLASLVSAALVALTSPYHLSNFTHPLVIMAGRNRDIFQAIVEWRPPHALVGIMPQAMGFWVLAALSAAIWIAAALRKQAPPPGDEQATRTRPGAAFDTTEVLLAVAGFYLGLKHLRFMPLFVLLSVPVTAKLLAAALARQRRLQRRPGTGIICLNLGLIIFLGGICAGDLRQAYLPSSEEPYATRLFHHQILHDADPAELVDFAARYGVSGPVYNEWSWGGYLMFHAPQLKLFIDGRAQALYSAEHCERYFRLKNDPSQDQQPAVLRGRRIDGQLARLGVNLVLAKHTPEWASRIVGPLLKTGYWHPLIETDNGILLVNGLSNDPATRRLMGRYWAGELDWPDNWHGWWIRGHVWQNGPDPDHKRAVHAYQRALALTPQDWLYERLLVSWQRIGRLKEAAAYFQAERRRLLKLAAESPEQKRPAQACLPTVERILTKLHQTNR